MEDKRCDQNACRRSREHTTGSYASLIVCSVLARQLRRHEGHIVGGAGFVGSRVCKILVGAGAEVTSLSKSGKIPEWAASEEWTRNVRWNAIDLLDAEDAAIDAAMNNPTGIVSCLGVVDSNVETLRLGNGVANINALLLPSVLVSSAPCTFRWRRKWRLAKKIGFRLQRKSSPRTSRENRCRGCGCGRCWSGRDEAVSSSQAIYGAARGAAPRQVCRSRVSSDYGYFVEELLSFDQLSPRRRCFWADQGRATTSRECGGRGGSVCIRRAGRTDKGPGDTQGSGRTGRYQRRRRRRVGSTSRSATDSTVRWTP